VCICVSDSGTLPVAVGFLMNPGLIPGRLGCFPA
jgi:hypothetical protein